MDTRKCSRCGNSTKGIDKRTGRPIWHWDNDKLLCDTCHRSDRNKREYVKVTFDKRLIRMDTSSRFCSICKSKDTYINKRGCPVWSRGEKENEFICSRCIKPKYR